MIAELPYRPQGKLFEQRRATPACWWHIRVAAVGKKEKEERERGQRRKYRLELTIETFGAAIRQWISLRPFRKAVTTKVSGCRM